MVHSSNPPTFLRLRVVLGPYIDLVTALADHHALAEVVDMQQTLARLTLRFGYDLADLGVTL